MNLGRQRQALVRAAGPGHEVKRETTHAGLSPRTEPSLLLTTKQTGFLFDHGTWPPKSLALNQQQVLVWVFHLAIHGSLAPAREAYTGTCP